MDSFTSAVYAILIAFAISAVLCPLFIPLLIKIKFGQQVRSDGPETHLKKAGTPTMGGLMILSGFIITSLFFVTKSPDAWMVLFVTAGYGVIGFIDDYIKVVKKRSLGLKAKQKILFQLIITTVLVIYLYQGDRSFSEIYIPFTNGKTINLGLFYIPFIYFAIIATVNSVNLTDGLDGLAAGITVLVATFFLFVAWATGSQIVSVIGAAVGALMGFLLFNAHPARVMMGDIGSLSLGGFVITCAIILRMPLFILIVGFIYVAEALSVVIQVTYFKWSGGKRIFKMAPIHHHFEKCGWAETKVVAVFYIVTAIMCLIGFLGAKNLFF